MLSDRKNQNNTQTQHNPYQNPMTFFAEIAKTNHNVHIKI
jgi:hypothetical protein